MEKIINKINLIYGGVIAVMTAVFGQYWFLFAAFLVFNIVDYITGTIKARYLKIESSKIGAIGIYKKVGYWIVICISFFVSFACAQFGDKFDMNLNFIMMFGWFTLGTYLINELRSILENLVTVNVPIPDFLIKGLEIADKAIENLTNKD